MKQSAILSNTDRTSWRRIMMVGQYFMPRLRTKLLIAFLCSVAIAALCYKFGMGNLNSPSPTWALVTIMVLFIEFMPLAFAKRSSDEVFYSLPALGFEKCAFVFIYSYIVVPAVTLGPIFLYLTIFGSEVDLDVVMRKFYNVRSTFGTPLLSFFIANMFGSLSLVAVGLWTVFASRRNRSLNGVFAIFGTLFINAIFGFIMGFIAAYYADNADTAEEIKNAIMSMGPIMAAFWILFFSFTIYKAARAISRKQV